MKDLKKYEGIIPALYACYDDNGAVSIERTKALTQWFIDQGVNGLYVGGSSGECIYQNKEERKAVLEAVMDMQASSLWKRVWQERILVMPKYPRSIVVLL